MAGADSARQRRGVDACGGREAFSTFGWHFLIDSDWDAVNHKFGALVPIYGTLVTALIAMLIAVPVSFGIALFLTEVAPNWLRGPIASAIELLAGIPSIIYGMWGLFVFVPFMAAHVIPFLNAHLGQWPIIGPLFRGPPLGIGMLTAGIVLAIMVIPFISAVMRDVFLSVPTRLKESAYALGSTTGKWRGTSCCPTRARRSSAACFSGWAARSAKRWRSRSCSATRTCFRRRC